MIETKPIHTLNARGNVMLEVMRDYFKLDPQRMQREIQGMRRMLEESLASKGIVYADLRNALVPRRDRREIALVFDTTSIEGSCYGYNVFERIIPLMERKHTSHSILVGDYLDRPGQMEMLFRAFEESVRVRRSVEFRHPTQFYIVYLNNLSDAMVKRFDEGLASYEPYVGYADTTYANMFKTYLSTMLVNLGIKHRSVFIQGHEPDRDDAEDVNMCGYPFEEAGFTCRSVNSDLEGVLLTYKIERPVFQGFEVDTEFALNAISLLPMSLDDFEIEVEEAKLSYVKEAKNGSVESAGLEDITTSELAEIIKAKISANYIYEMDFKAEFDVAKFNIIIEIPSRYGSEPTRIMAALKYKPEEKRLKLITLF